MIVVSVISAWMACRHFNVSPLPSTRGLIFSISWPDLDDSCLSSLLNMAGNAAIVFMMWLINRTFNIIRSVSWFFLGFFMIIQMSVPATMVNFGDGTILCMLMLCVMMLIYSIYMEPWQTKRIFLAFFILGSGALMQYAYMAYVPVLLAGCAQMRVLTFRTILAALVGIVTPTWILWGFGIADLGDFDLSIIMGNFASFSRHDFIVMASTVGVTLIAGLIFGVTNLIKVYSYNARSRALNGLMALLSMATGALCIVDFANLPTYIPLLNCCVAFQTGIFFRINGQRRAYLPVLILIIVYSMLYSWNISL